MRNERTYRFLSYWAVAGWCNGCSYWSSWRAPSLGKPTRQLNPLGIGKALTERIRLDSFGYLICLYDLVWIVINYASCTCLWSGIKFLLESREGTVQDDSSWISAKSFMCGDGGFPPGHELAPTPCHICFSTTTASHMQKSQWYERQRHFGNVSSYCNAWAMDCNYQLSSISSLPSCQYQSFAWQPPATSSVIINPKTSICWMHLFDLFGTLSWYTGIHLRTMHI